MRRRNICAICWQQQRPLEFNLSFNPRREICYYCGQPNFDGFYVREDRKEKPHGQERPQQEEGGL